MNIDNEKHETESKAEVLQSLEEKVKVWMEAHIEKRKMWFSSDFLPADERNSDDQENIIIKLRERIRGIKDSARVAVGLNLITEEGLPHFHRILSKYLGDDSFWSQWNYMWTAEEDRHGNILRDYARDSRLFNFSKLEQMQYVYVEKGFDPDWDKDPYKVFET
jgi:acyl-[acyl-carrier-protein] desaturase